MSELEDRLRDLESEGVRARSSRRPAARPSATSSGSPSAAERETEHLDDVLSAFKTPAVKQLVADDSVYRSLRERFGDYFDGGMGAEAIKRLLVDLDLEAEGEFLARPDQDRPRARAARRPSSG